LHWIYVAGIALGLAMDALAVSVAAGANIARLTPRHVFRLGFHFGLFQFLMCVVGWLAGPRLAAVLHGYDDWVAGGLLGLLGAKMLWESWQGGDREDRTDPTRGLMLVTLSLATSMDALAAGLSMSLLKVDIAGPSIVVGLVAGTLTALGITFGNRVNQRWGRRAEVLGGSVLMLVGLWIVF
jgi:manganese efflux pump family protein